MFGESTYRRHSVSGLRASARSSARMMSETCCAVATWVVFTSSSTKMSAFTSFTTFAIARTTSRFPNRCPDFVGP